MTKTIGTVLLLIGFSGMAIFGLFVMDFAMEHENGGCIASRVSGNNNVCPMSILPMVFHHISAFQSFSLSTAVFSFILGLITLSAFLRLFIKVLSFHPPRFFMRLRKTHNIAPSFFQKQKIIRWLALFEHSPSFF